MDLVNRYIKVTRENEKEVLRALEELGFVWVGTGEKPTNFTPITLKLWNHNILCIGSSKNIFGSTMRESFTEITLDELKSHLPSDAKVIRSLKDLDGLENGMGIHLSWVKSKKHININYKDTLFTYFTENDINNANCIETLKAMGFEFEYKPLRTEQEVKNEILKLESLPFIHEKANYYVGYNSLINKYLVICDSVNGHGLHIYMTEEQAQKYADELNEILGSRCLQ